MQQLWLCGFVQVGLKVDRKQQDWFENGGVVLSRFWMLVCILSCGLNLQLLFMFYSEQVLILCGVVLGRQLLLVQCEKQLLFSVSLMGLMFQFVLMWWCQCWMIWFCRKWLVFLRQGLVGLNWCLYLMMQVLLKFRLRCFVLLGVECQCFFRLMFEVFRLFWFFFFRISVGQVLIGFCMMQLVQCVGFFRMILLERLLMMLVLVMCQQFRLMVVFFIGLKVILVDSCLFFLGFRLGLEIFCVGYWLKVLQMLLYRNVGLVLQEVGWQSLLKDGVWNFVLVEVCRISVLLGWQCRFSLGFMELLIFLQWLVCSVVWIFRVLVSGVLSLVQVDVMLWLQFVVCSVCVMLEELWFLLMLLLISSVEGVNFCVLWCSLVLRVRFRLLFLSWVSVLVILKFSFVVVFLFL